MPVSYIQQVDRGFNVLDIQNLRQQQQQPLQEQEQEAEQEEGEGQGQGQQRHLWAVRWLSALASVRLRGCLMPEDKVLATLGMLQRLLSLEPSPNPALESELAPLLAADVAPKTAQEVYVVASRLLLQHCPELTLLSLVDLPVHSQQRLAGLPA